MLLTQIKEDQVQARKDRNKELATFLTTLYSEIAMVGKNDGDRDTTDAEAIVVLKKFVKNANEVMDNVHSTDGRHIHATNEIVVLTNYLPVPLSSAELLKIIETVIHNKDLTSPKDMGIIMKELKNNYTGLYDGKEASTISKRLLIG